MAKRKKIITENFNQSKWRIVEPSPNKYIYKHSHLRLMEHCESGHIRIAVTLCFVVMLEVHKSHIHDCLNKVEEVKFSQSYKELLTKAHFETRTPQINDLTMYQTMSL